MSCSASPKVQILKIATFSKGRKLVHYCGEFLYGVPFNPDILNKVEKKGIETIFPFYPKMI